MRSPAYSWTGGQRLRAAALALSIGSLVTAGAAAQQRRPQAPEPPIAATTPEPGAEAQVPNHVEDHPSGVVVVSHGSESRIRILGSLVVERGQRAGDVVAILGSVTVRGDVEGDVVAVGGGIEVADGASVSGNLVAVGGRLDVSPGARVSAHSERIAIGFPEFSVSSPGDPQVSFRFLPDRAWLAGMALTGSVVRLTALAVLCVMALVLFGPAIDRVARRVAESPGESLVVGIGVQLLLAPAVLALSVGLAITVIGIPLVPLFILMVAGAWMTVFAAAAVALGRGMLRLVGARGAGLLPCFIVGMLPAVGLTLASRIAWWNGVSLGGWAMGVAMLGALVEGVLWTLGAGAGLLEWLRRKGRATAAPPAIPPEPEDGTPVPVQL
jgi:hypothetical protein